MSAFKVKNLWTAFITAFFAILASLGLATAAQAASTNTVPESAPTPRTHTAAPPATVSTPSVRWTLPRDRALPPTMKQRIRAEAHGSSPATRQLATDTLSTAHSTLAARASLLSAPDRDTVPLPP